MTDLFKAKNCDRCNTELVGRKMSWFTEETICMSCSDKEDIIKRSSSDGGTSLEGCGYVPTIKGEV